MSELKDSIQKLELQRQLFESRAQLCAHSLRKLSDTVAAETTPSGRLISSATAGLLTGLIAAPAPEKAEQQNPGASPITSPHRAPASATSASADESGAGQTSSDKTGGFDISDTIGSVLVSLGTRTLFNAALQPLMERYGLKLDDGGADSSAKASEVSSARSAEKTVALASLMRPDHG